MPVSDKFTLLELTTLALKFPEAGVVNFNILYTVISSIIEKIGIGDDRVPCFVHDEVLAQTAVAQRKLKRTTARGQSDVSDVSAQEMKDIMMNSDWIKPAEEESTAQEKSPLDIDASILFDEEPANVIEHIWKATNIDRRMDAAELGLTKLSELIDNMIDKILNIEDNSGEVNKLKYLLKRMKELEVASTLHARQIDDSNEVRASEVERLEEIINEIKAEHEEAKSAIGNIQLDLNEKVAYKSDLEEAKEQMAEDLKLNTKEIKKLIREVEESLVSKDDFQELLSVVEQLEEEKVSREDLGRLLEPGFIDNFLNEQVNLRVELNELNEKTLSLQDNQENLKTMIQNDVINVMKKNLGAVHSTLDEINAKLALLDPDEINDSFANLEESVEVMKGDLGDLKLTFDQVQKEAKTFFSKITNVNEWLSRLEQVKMDKSKFYEMLEKKADVSLVMGKLDRSEFTLVIGNLRDDMERLSIKVKINEEEMTESFDKVREELSLQMYKEDFIYCTEPIRNRIKALIYELKRVKEIALTHLFPDAPGIAKCISCNRGAHLAGAKYAGDCRLEFDEDIPPGSHVQMAIDKSSKHDTDSGETSCLSVPPTDLDSVPFPPPDKPRERDPSRLPVLFATARPNIGLTHEKRRSTIDKELANYFSKKPIRSIDGEHTRMKAQQRGTSFSTFRLSLPEKEEVLVKGKDDSIYKGSLDKGIKTKETQEETLPILKKPKIRKELSKSSTKHQTSAEKQDIVLPSISLHINNEPLYKPAPLTRTSREVLFPSNQADKKTRGKM